MKYVISISTEESVMEAEGCRPQSIKKSWEHEKDKTARYLERRKVSGKQDWPIIGREKGTEFACMF